ncbi:MAG: M56 family metallopeptidase, partial [Acidobacteriia bacterium]|nr:M56 family metallopeptidase [Terriglobia bacterium]
MLTHLADVSLRSLLLALVAAAVLWVLRNRRTAAIEHAVWSIVMIAMLGLFAFGEVFPRLPLRVLGGRIAPAPEARSGEIAPLQDRVYSEMPQPLTPATPHRPLDWKIVAMGAYAAVALAFLARFSAGIFFVRKLLRTAQPVSCGRDGVNESNRIAVPVTAGFVHPKIFLPANWREWDASKLDLVLTHEAAHIRRRDGLIAALAGLNRCIYWFHPLAWILQRRLALLAEQACDEYCVAERGGREQYARLLLEMASAVDRSMGRLNRHATMMAAGPHIR